MDLHDVLAQANSAILRAEAEGFDNTAAALREFAFELEQRHSDELISAKNFAETSHRLTNSSTKLMRG